jgi:hypothetical protein
LKNREGTFVPVFEGQGIGGYNLRSADDRALAFDYDHSGKPDHLVVYRLGTSTIWILKNDGNGIFTPVYKHSESNPAVSAEDLGSLAEQMFAFDYDHSGKLDHLVLDRPGTGTMEIWTNSECRLSPVRTIHVPDDGTGPGDSQQSAYQAFAVDYDHSGKLDHLVICRPGLGTAAIFKNSGGISTPVYEVHGIGGYDLKSANDRALAFDYGHTGKLDHLLLYRPGTGIVSVLKNTGGTFTPAYAGMGIGDYDLKHPDDRVLAFDYDHAGRLDHLLLYRPGTGSVQIAYFP